MVKRSKHASSCNLFSICNTYCSKRSPLHVLSTTNCRIVEGNYKHLWHILVIRLEKLKSDQEVKLHCGKNGAWCLFPRPPRPALPLGRFVQQYTSTQSTIHWFVQQYTLTQSTIYWFVQQYTLTQSTIHWFVQQYTLTQSTIHWFVQQYTSTQITIHWFF